MAAEMSFAQRCKTFFGKKSEQTLTEFAAELRALTDEDKAELVKLFNEAGMPTAAPVKRQS